MRARTVPTGTSLPRPAPSLGWVRLRPVTDRQGGSRGTDPAAQRLARAALVHPHADVPYTVHHEGVGGNDELDVGTVIRNRFKNRDGTEVDTVELLVAGQRHHNVRVAHVDAETRTTSPDLPSRTLE